MTDRRKEPSSFEYKCRRCGGIDSSTGTNGLDAMDILMSLVFKMAMPPKFRDQPMNPKMHDIHNCGDGGCGVSDLIGITNSGSNL